MPWQNSSWSSASEEKVARVAAGEWRGLEVAIKTVIFQSDESDNTMSRLASEAAIASNLSHTNVVAMYSHDICTVSSDAHNELDIYKFYLIQVCCGPFLSLAPHTGVAVAGHAPLRAVVVGPRGQMPGRMSHDS